MDSAEKNETKFGESAIQLGHVNEEDFLKVFSEQILTPYVDLKFFNIERSALEFLDKEAARRLIAVPLFEAGNTLAIGFHDPLNLDAIDEIELKTGKTVQVVLCSKELLKNVIQNSYSIEIIDEEKADDDNADAIIELVERLIEEAVESDASDIHIQPSEFDLDIRYRIDGVIQSIMVLPVSRTRAINSPSQSDGKS